MASKIFIFVIDLYQKYISPFMGQHCRFAPRCSSYARTALEKKGFIEGFTLSLKRILRCHPFHPGGIDDVE